MSKALDELIKGKLLRFLTLNCQGMSSAIVKEALIAKIDTCYGFKLSERELRSYIAELPEIGSHNSAGYFYNADKADLEASISEKKARVKALGDRIKKEEDSFYKRQGNQGSLL
jgi:hypothetical protein